MAALFLLESEVTLIEIKIPKEVRDYHETIFFGLNTRQFICSLLALGVAVGVYFLLRPLLGTEEVGWVCILAFPQLWNNLSAAQFGWLLAGGMRILLLPQYDRRAVVLGVVQIRAPEPQAAGLSLQQLLLRCNPGRDAYEETKTEEAQP